MSAAIVRNVPVDIVFHPDWWHTHYGLDFCEPFHSLNCIVASIEPKLNLHCNCSVQLISRATYRNCCDYLPLPGHSRQGMLEWANLLACPG